MSLSRADRRKLARLKAEGYFNNYNPLTSRVVKEVVVAARADTERPGWLDVFLNEDSGGEENSLEQGGITSVSPVEHSVFRLFGRSSDLHSKYRNPRVLLSWIRYGLGHSPASIANLCDVSQGFASQVRLVWEGEIRSLLEEAACLRLTGEDIYFACSDGIPPKRLLERLSELRMARGSAGGMLRSEFETWIKQEWAEYKRLYPGKHEMDFPPRWFVEHLCNEDDNY